MSTDPFVTQLADLCRVERTRAKWVFVPRHAVGLTLGDRLAREGCDWANLRFSTPLDIAIRMAAPFLLERGIDPSEEPLGPALMMRLLLDLPDTHDYFRPMAEHTSMADALWRTVRELRYAGVGARDLAARPFSAASDKQAELIALLAAYEGYLETNHLADMPMVFEEATRHPGWCSIASTDIVIELPDTLWSPLVRRFLDTLPGQRVLARAPILPEVPIPSRADALAASVVRVDLHTTTDAGRLRYLQSPRSAGKAKGDGTLDLFHAGGRDAEVDEVFRRILASGLPLDQVEVVCASVAYTLLVREKATLLDWGVTLAAGVPATMARPGRLLLRFFDWVASDFAARDLRRLLQSGDCAPRAFEDTDTGVSPGQAARLLLKAEATWGRETYTPALTRLAEKYERRASDGELSDEDRAWNVRKAAQTTTLRQWVESVLASVPEPGGAGAGVVPLTSLVECARTFLEANAGRASALDAIAYVAVGDALADLRAMGHHCCDLATGLNYLRERVTSLTVGRDRPRPGRLHVSTLADAGFDGRRLVFVVGLQEGGVFPAAVEDAVLLDEERTVIDPLLRTSAQRQDEAVFAARSRLAAIGASAERVCLSFSCRDTRDFRETFPSWIVLQAFRLMKADPALNYEDLGTWLGEPVSAVPASAARAVSDAGWWLAHTKATSTARDAILRAYPLLERGIHAENQRASDAFTEYDGYVAIAGPVLDPSRSGRRVSATTLESAAKCPLRYFIGQGLGVKAIEEGRPDDDAWLDPATKGTELHAMFARIMRATRAERRKPSLAVDRRRLRKWGHERLDELRAGMPPPSDEVFARESREFLDDLDAFIEAECEGLHGEGPLGFEVSFGFPLDDDEEEPLASAEPVVVDVGDKRRIALHGRIDRINRVGPGEYEVADYKTGGYWRDDWDGHFAGGTRLQHALYGVAAAALLQSRDPKARVVRGVYLFPAVKGYRRRKVIPAPSKAKLASVLRDLADVLGNGAFVSADTEDRCKWCQFAAACHAQDVSCAKSKIEGDAGTALEPYRRLRGNHE